MMKMRCPQGRRICFLGVLEMRGIRVGYGIIIGALALLWAASFGGMGAGFFGLRGAAVDFTGMMALGVMSVAMILAARPAVLEPLLDGLDKEYRLHKWLGITGLVFAVLHWLWAQGPKWAVGWGLLARPERHRGPPLDGLFGLFQSLRGTAEGIGEWAFYGISALIVLALIKAVPYRWFRRLHRVLPLAYLALVVHGVILLPPAWWTAPLGPVMGLLMAGGVIAALLSLTGRLGHRNAVSGRVAAVQPRGDATEVTVALDAGRWPGHQAGQFAFLTLDRGEGPHPFTIASAWRGDGHLTFLIKGLGDYTRRLAENVRVGDSATVQGPYGRFVFDGARRQIWIAGGIGITPFLARLDALAAHPGTPPAQPGAVDLFYAASAPEPSVVARVRALAEAAGVRLHVIDDRVDERLTGEHLRQSIPEWREADVWFCGPRGFSRALAGDLCGHGLPAPRFHHELFEMR